MKNLKSGRVLLDNEALESLNEMYRALKEEGGSYLKLNASSLVSKIVSNFKENHFEKEKVKIKEGLFNKMSYIKFLTRSGASVDEIIDKVSKLKGSSHNVKKKVKKDSESVQKQGFKEREVADERA